MNKLLALTLGDPWSVSCESIYRVLIQHRQNLRDSTFPILIIGSKDQWQLQMKPMPNELQIDLVKLNQQMTFMNSIREIPSLKNIGFYDVGNPSMNGIPANLWQPLDRGTVAKAALDVVKELDFVRRLAVLTSPIHKNAANLAGFGCGGQTEYFSQIWGARAVMILASPKLRVGLVTNHVPISKVSGLLTKELIASKARTFAQTIGSMVQKSCPRIAVLGLNPHASDGGLFGDEEETIIQPAIEELNRTTNNCGIFIGPVAGDTAFHFAVEGRYDGVLAMYHDQGLGPIKTLGFYDAVNISAGLKHLRVSPDHGPASDQFGCNTARIDSFEQCFKICNSYLEVIS